VVRSCKCFGTKSQVVATVGIYYTVIVNRKGELYITSGRNTLCNV
jgi:hypothetical protein